MSAREEKRSKQFCSNLLPLKYGEKLSKIFFGAKLEEVGNNFLFLVTQTLARKGGQNLVI